VFSAPEDPVFTSTLLDEEQLVVWILRRLGAPMWKVELTREHIEEAVTSAKNWFAANKGVQRMMEISVHAGQPEYLLADWVDTVLEIALYERASDVSLIFSPYLLLDEKVPYDVFATPQSLGLYSSFLQTMQYVEMAKRILGADPSWRQDGRYLFLSPTPVSEAKANLLYKSSVFRLTELDQRDHKYVRDYSLALAMRDLAMVRGKYDGFPAAEGDRRLNWEQLQEQANKMIESLDEKILQAGYPMGFLTG
jgi:hypothetical protein